MKELEADVVIVGGGAAGTYTAIQAEALGLKPLIVTKGLVGKSGCSIFAGNLIVSGRMFDTTDEQFDATAEYFIKWLNHFLVDQDYLIRGGDWIEETFFPELDEAGLYFRRDDQGSVVMSIGKSRTMAALQQGQSGMLLMDRRRKQVLEKDIPRLEETTVTRLLTDGNGHVVGVTGLHYPTGELYAIRGKAVVLATGHADRLAKRSTGTREQSADGIALAFRVGADLINLEMQWWHASDFAYPKTWQRMHNYPNPLLGTSQTARMYNADGEQFFDQSTDTPAAIAPYATQFKRVGQQVEKGKANYDSGFYTGYDHIDPEVMKAFNYHAKAFEKLGFDIGKDRMESGVSWHFRQGGIDVDTSTMATSVPGLYAAGAIGGQTNGSVSMASFDATILARTFADRSIAGAPQPELPDEQVSEEEERLTDLLRPLAADGVTPMHIKKRIWELMWEKMGFVKSGPVMEETLDELAALRREMVPRMGLKNTTRRFNYGWVDAIDILNMLDVCEITIHSSLNRKESRGAFYRTDYPVTDNENWLAKNILRKTEGGLEFRIKPYQTTHIKPDFVKKDALSVDW